jgi:DNA-binding winged helix-turn-helix (wHTH) protein/tetratricopeptide (TPR) repeat protein/TolB-like protein
VNSPIPSPMKEMFAFGPFRLDTLGHILQKDGKTLPLPPKAFELLVLLVKRKGELLTKAELLNALWPNTFVEENNLTQYISMLRKLLGEVAAEDQKYIETIPRLGYRFVGNVETLPANGESLLWTTQKKTKVVIREEEEEEFDDGTEPGEISAPANNLLQTKRAILGIPHKAAGEALASRISVGWRWILASILALTAIAAVFIAVRPRRPRNTPALASSVVVAIKPRHSVAVLGVKSLSVRKEDEWLPGALTEMLSTELAAGGQLRVVPGEDTSRAKADLQLPDAAGFSKSTLSQIRNRLGSDVVVSGSMVDLNRTSGKQIRLDLRVQDTVSGETLASIAQTGTADNLFALVSRSGAQLRESLGVPLVSGTEESELQAALPSTPEAARLYSEGLLRLRSYDGLAAQKLFSKAVSLEPSFALGHSALARAWSALGYDERAKLAAKRAFDLSENLSREDRLAIAAQYRETLRDWDKAAETYQVLCGLFPDNLEYGLRLADTQTSAGKGKDALATVQQLRKLPPLMSRDPRIDLAEAIAYESLGDFQQDKLLAERAAKNAELIGQRMVVARATAKEGWALRRLGQKEEATAALQRAQELFSAGGDEQGVASALRTSGTIFAELGEYARAQKDCERALGIFQRVGDRRGTALSLNSLAIIHYERGEFNAAKALYERVLEIQREVGSKTNTAGALGNIANVADAQGKLAEALKLNEESLAIFRETGDQRATGTALGNVAVLLYEMGDLEGAKAKYAESLAIKEKIGYQRGIAYDLAGLGEVLHSEGDLVAARKNQEEALAIRVRIGEKHNAASSELYLAQLSLDEGKAQDAENGARKAFKELENEKSEADEAMAQVILSQSLLAQQKIPDSLSAISLAEKVSRKTSSIPLQFEVVLASARIVITDQSVGASRRAADSRQKVESALSQAKRHGYLEYQLKFRLLLGEIELLLGNSFQARREMEAVQKDAKAHGFGLLARNAEALLARF